MFGEPMHLDTPNKYACILKQKSCLCRRGGTLLKIRELFVLNAKLLKQKEKKKDFGEKTQTQSCFNTQLQDGQSSKVGGEEEPTLIMNVSLLSLLFRGKGSRKKDHAG